jgi:hypothetical protein
MRDDAAERGREPQAAAGVRPGREGHHVGRQHDAGAAGRSSAGLLEIERVAGGAVKLVVGVPTGAEFRAVGLADDDPACAPDGRDHVLIPGRHVVPVQEGAVGRHDALRVAQVLDADRQTMQRRQRVAAHDGSFRFGRLLSSTIEGLHHERIDVRIDGFDLLNAGFQQLDGGKLLLSDESPRFDGIELAGSGHVIVLSNQ